MGKPSYIFGETTAMTPYAHLIRKTTFGLSCEYEFWLRFMQRVFYSWRWWGTDMAIARYCPKSVWPLSPPGFTVITPKVQKLTHCTVQTHFTTWSNTILCTTLLLSRPRRKTASHGKGVLYSTHMSNTFVMEWLYFNHVKSPNTLQTHMAHYVLLNVQKLYSSL